MLHSDVIGSNELPPGFEASTSTKHLKKELHRIPQIRWSCPPKFIISHNWQVVAGEESKEVEAQKLRASRMLEAVYPRPSAIPPSPSVSLDIENERYDDSLTPLVPINPIEEEDSEDLPSEPTVDLNNLVCSQPSASGPMNIPTSSAPAAPASEKSAPGISHVGADVIAAASTALAAIMKSNQQGSLIDTDLLIKILSDPKMIQNLISDHPPPPTPVNPAVNPPANAVSAPANTATPPANAVSAPANTAATANAGVSMIVSKPVTALVHTSSVSVSKPDTQRAGNGNLHPVLNGFRPTLNPIPPQPPQLVPSIAMSCLIQQNLTEQSMQMEIKPCTKLVRLTTLMLPNPITGPMSSSRSSEALCQLL
ncbi:Zinc finger CCCH domain-containing protein 30 [Morella rubra]|uniref:Zinc finger CCCH domain-containing protein 30 n=1 Tax=Morella rubra TaxID=262757 RepID=A0A6A1UN02_9ROSI|nr:Zinc finger CCCH domain-containing protein 30 [Morella rubra]